MENFGCDLIFLYSFGRDQTCAMLLAIASGNTFLELGDESALGTLSTMNPEIAAVAKQAFYDFGERPLWSERVTYGTGKRNCLLSSGNLTRLIGGGTGTATFSGRREGLALYFARLVRPIWKARITKSGWVLHIDVITIRINVTVPQCRSSAAAKSFRNCLGDCSKEFVCIEGAFRQKPASLPFGPR